ncbi:hypothetical protein GGF31_003439 [Allomyces arbusculus]|nr:hypothetical protein GGF31_003439 [Allomyces arbusculus]
MSTHTIKLEKKSSMLVVTDEHGCAVRLVLRNVTEVAQAFEANTYSTSKAQKGYMSFHLDSENAQLIHNVEQNIVEQMKTSVSSMSNIKITPRTLERNFKPSVSSQSIFKVSVQGKDSIAFFDHSTSPMDPDIGYQVCTQQFLSMCSDDVRPTWNMLVEPALVWLFNGTIGITWYLRQIRFNTSAEKLESMVTAHEGGVATTTGDSWALTLSDDED